MNNCKYYKDGECHKCNAWIGDCKVHKFDCDFCVLENSSEEVCRFTDENASHGNRYIGVTVASIEALLNGKVLAYSDGEYCTFVALKGGDEK